MNSCVDFDNPDFNPRHFWPDASARVELLRYNICKYNFLSTKQEKFISCTGTGTVHSVHYVVGTVTQLF
jgi:hypothetical protein